MPTRRTRSARPIAALIALVASGCVGTATTPEPTPAVLEPPEIEFAGLVTDVRALADLTEVTDAAGRVRAIDIGQYRQIGEHACCFDLLVLGRDADGPFLATFPTQGGLPDDCYVENDVGIDRGSYIEILGVLWRKAPGFPGTVLFGTQYPPGTRFCFDQNGLISSTVAN